uniref:ATP synthase F0 subunit 8 n=1 Tax=Pardosa pusiola TaxID=330962 RepID=UPI0020370AB5|nr:ATP synthase F0 subunit 8 [Pardosa pusiola]URC16620.1 ATP synthase F0 subunit 8 [Pardosa pusiola]
MPFYWMNSVLMVFFILISLLILFFFKKMELVNKLSHNSMSSSKDLNFNFLW